MGHQESAGIAFKRVDLDFVTDKEEEAREHEYCGYLKPSRGLCKTY